MAKLYRNATTDEYYTDTAMDGEFVTLTIHPEGSAYLLDHGVEEGSRIPAELLVVLEENEWVSLADESSHRTSRFADEPLVNESETNASVTDARLQPDEPLPSVRMEPRPWMEQENVDHMKAETNPMDPDAGHSERKFSATTADVENANPLTHGEDAAFVGNVWFWVLVVAAVVIIAWGLIEIL